jgi:hypothetical protein
MAISQRFAPRIEVDSGNWRSECCLKGRNYNYRRSPLATSLAAACGNKLPILAIIAWFAAGNVLRAPADRPPKNNSR